MLVTPTQVQATFDRHEDLVAAVVRDRLITAATQPLPSTMPRQVGRIRDGLRHMVAALAALAAIG